MKYINWVFFAFCVVISSVTASKSIVEFRVKVGDVLERYFTQKRESSFYWEFRLKYPGKIANINDLGYEGIINTAIDFEKGSKPNFVQLALIPKNEKFSEITFDMDYKESASKATLSVVKCKILGNFYNNIFRIWRD